MRFGSRVAAAGGHLHCEHSGDIVRYRYLPFTTETLELLIKSCKTFDSLFVNIECATAWSLEKVNFKV